MKLDLACGQNKREGFIGIDIAKVDGVDLVHDLRVAPWPVESDSVEEARSIHFFEHLTGFERMVFMNELGRVLQAGAKATIQAPYWTSVRAIQDPTHQMPGIAERSFLYFNKNWRVENKLDHYPITCDFDYTWGYVMNPAWATRHHEAQAFAINHYYNVADDIIVTLVKR